MTDLFYSFGLMHPGAVTLHNYPRALQQFTRPDGVLIDLAAHDIMRCRELGVPRYTKFREMLHMRPVRTFEDLTDNPTWREEIRRVYEGDIDRVDLIVGLFAETPPKGFGFSDTAFRIFVLMASRRLNSDRFFTVRLHGRGLQQGGYGLDSRQYDELSPPAPPSRIGANLAWCKQCIRALDARRKHHGVTLRLSTPEHVTIGYSGTGATTRWRFLVGKPISAQRKKIVVIAALIAIMGSVVLPLTRNHRYIALFFIAFMVVALVYVLAQLAELKRSDRL